MRQSKTKNNKGFTLVELIIVVAIIAVLAAVLAPQYLQYVERARQSNDLQTATNLLRAATVAVADPKSNLPSNGLIEVLWATGTGPQEEYYGGKLYVRAPQPAYRDSVLVNEPYVEVDTQSLDHLQTMILGIMGVDTVEGNTAWQGAGGELRDAESAIGNSTSLCFHINTTTGQIALAQFKNASGSDGDVNVWIDEIGIDAIPAP